MRFMEFRTIKVQDYLDHLQAGIPQAPLVIKDDSPPASSLNDSDLMDDP